MIERSQVLDLETHDHKGPDHDGPADRARSKAFASQAEPAAGDRDLVALTM